MNQLSVDTLTGAPESMTKINPKEAACLEFVVEALQAFLDAAEQTKKIGPSNLGMGYIESQGVGVYLTKQYSIACQRAAIAVSELSKSNKSSLQSIEKDIQRRGFNILSLRQHDINKLKENAKLVIENTKSSQTSTVMTYLPNYLISCEGGVRISIGPVSIVPAEINAEINGGGILRSKDATEGNLMLPPEYPPTNSMWLVQSECHVDNAYSESVWLIDIAVSLLRVGCRNWEGGFFPDSGMLESHPSEHSKFFGIYSVICGDTEYHRLDDMPRGMTLTTEIIKELSSDHFIKKCKEVFYSQGEKTLGERVSSGLGWLTRSRRARDRAERLLYAVTAIECLLSPRKGEGGIIQTISRSAGIILSTELSGRLEIYKTLKNYYSDRSAVVHQGKRDVFKHRSVDMYFLAECMYREVISKCNLKMAHREFQYTLTEESLKVDWNTKPT